MVGRRAARARGSRLTVCGSEPDALPGGGSAVLENVRRGSSCSAWGSMPDVAEDLRPPLAPERPELIRMLQPGDPAAHCGTVSSPALRLSGSGLIVVRVRGHLPARRPSATSSHARRDCGEPERGVLESTICSPSARGRAGHPCVPGRRQLVQSSSLRAITNVRPRRAAHRPAEPSQSSSLLIRFRSTARTATCASSATANPSPANRSSWVSPCRYRK